MNTQRTLRLPVLLAMAALAACDGTGPASPMIADDMPLMGAFAKGGKKLQNITIEETTSTAVLVEEITILDRWQPLAEDVVASKVIGRDGGFIINWQGGVNLYVPPGALKKDTEITVTALAGSKLAFDFQPHGLRFHEPVRIGIFKGLGVGEDSAIGVYYEGDPKGNPNILECYVVFDWDTYTALETNHFSGYALASGSKSSRSISGSSF